MSASSSSTVQLFRYDISNGMARSMGPMLIGRPLEGIWHTSIVAFGREFYFDGGVGIVADARPGQTRFGQPYRREELGRTTKSETAFIAWCQTLRQGCAAGYFGPNDYNLLNNNCNHFSQVASQFLLGRDIPADVRNMIPDLLSTPLGQMIRPTLEQMTSAPPGSASFPMPTPTVAAAASSSSSAPIPGFPSSSSSSAPSAARTVGANTTGPSSQDVCRGLLSPRTGLSASEEEDVDLLRATLESNELIASGDVTTDGFETTLTSLNLLRTVMENIVAFPTEAKYRAVSTCSKTYTTKLKRLEPFGALDVLRLAGFTLRPHASGTGGEQWHLSDAAGSRGVLQQLIRMLDEVIENIETAQAVALSTKEEHDSQAARTASSAAPPSTASGPSASAASAASVSVDGLLRYATAPYPTGYTPLVIGDEGGQPFYATCVAPSQSRESGVCLGKCHLNGRQDAQTRNETQFCAMNGAEKSVTGALSVLCVRDGAAESDLMWVPATLLRAALRAQDASLTDACVFRAHGRFGVARAPMGEPGAVHAGVYEPSGRCLIPYGGKAQVVTETAQVLCYRARLPDALQARVRGLHDGDVLLETLRVDRGKPWSSFSALRGWTPPIAPAGSAAAAASSALAVTLPGSTRPMAMAHAQPCPLRTRHTAFTGAAALAHAQKRLREEATPATEFDAREDRAHLLVCHDMKGGYTPADYAYFTVREDPHAGGDKSGDKTTTASAGDGAIAAVEEAYTVSYWQLMDMFVYFSHKRVSVPPFEWIEAGHRRGVPVLGTIITEGPQGKADLMAVLTDAKVMGETINKLVELCTHYGFDGYLLNVENGLDGATYVKRLELFMKMLRAKLRAALPKGSGLVIWYDAVTIDGQLRYQNALTPKNKPFMDLCDGIFTNYFWNPMHLAMSKAAAAGRDRDIYVGVDVFGRQMFGGGQYNTYTAVQEAAKSRLSVALFAPGWTAESEGHHARQTFLRAESRLWARMQDHFVPHAVSLASAADTSSASAVSGFFTCFTSGVGTAFSVDGRAVCPGASSAPAGSAFASAPPAGWCQLSAAHQEPCFEFLAPDDQIHQAAWTREGPRSSGTASTPLTAATAPLQCRLPLLGDGGRVHGGAITASWVTEASAVWFGDRALRFLVPPCGAVKVLDIHESLRLPTADSTTAALVELHVDVAFLEETTDKHTTSSSPSSASSAPPATSRSLRLSYQLDHSTASADSQTLHQVDLCEGDAAHCVLIAERPSAATRTSSAVWRVRRYTWRLTASTLGLASAASPSTPAPTVVVRAVSVANTCRDRSLQCHMGGLAVFASPTVRAAVDDEDEEKKGGESGERESPLVLGAPCTLTSPDATTAPWHAYPTSTTGVQVLAIPSNHFASSLRTRARLAVNGTVEVAVFAELCKGDSEAVTATVFVGVQRVRVPAAAASKGESDEPIVLIPVHAPTTWSIKNILYFPYSLPF